MLSKIIINSITTFCFKLTIILFLDLTVHCGAPLNYEALTAYNYTIYVAVSDGIFSDSSYLMISVLNENEPPSFNLDTYYVSLDEGQVYMSQNKYQVFVYFQSFL